VNTKIVATALISDIKGRIETVVNKVAGAEKPKVYYEVWCNTISLWTSGLKVWQNELIELAEETNIIADQAVDYFKSSAEVVIERDPDIILLPEEGMGFGEPFWRSLKTVKARLEWEDISAILNDRLCQVDLDTIAGARPRVADIIEDLAKPLHPELL
jgi:iron complex transport system substrate-binding protein